MFSWLLNHPATVSVHYWWHSKREMPLANSHTVKYRQKTINGVKTEGGKALSLPGLKNIFFSSCTSPPLYFRRCSKKRLVRSWPSPPAWNSWRTSSTACGRWWRKRKRARRTWRSRSLLCRLRSVTVSHSLSVHLNKAVIFVSHHTHQQLLNSDLYNSRELIWSLGWGSSSMDGNVSLSTTLV